jgi:hypothetical protein
MYQWESQHQGSSRDLIYLVPIDSKLVKTFGHDGHGTLGLHSHDIVHSYDGARVRVCIHAARVIFECMGI